MPSPATTMPAGSRTPAGQGQTKNTVLFARSTKKHFEPFLDVSTVLSTSAQVVAGTPASVPAFGFLRGIWVRVDATGGSGTTTAAVASGDAPFNIFANIALLDVNGAPIYGPFSNGYMAFLITKYGAYYRYGDPRANDFQAVQTSGNFRFWIYIPVELVRRSGLGSLANLNAAATYKLQFTIAPSTTVFTTAPAPTLPTIRIRCWLDAWTQPPATDLLGNMTEQVPPNHGTTQFWSEQDYTVAGGQQNIRLQRVGLYIRNLIFVLYSNATPSIRDDTDWPDPVQLFLDGYELQNVSQNFLWGRGFREYNLNPNSTDAAGSRDTGVYVFNFNDDYSPIPGAELRNRYLTTLQSSRLELRGSLGGAAQTLRVLTNDVSPAGDIFVGYAQTA